MKKIKELTMLVKGFEVKTKRSKVANEFKDEYIETTYTQLQTYELNIKGKLVKWTIKLNKLLTKKEEEALINSYILVDSDKDNLKEYQIDDFTKAYSCDSISIIGEIKECDTVFNVVSSVIMTVDNIQEKETKKTDKITKKAYLEKSYLFQTVVNENNSIKLLDVKVIADFIEVNDYLKQTVLLSDILEARVNGKVYFRTSTLPQAT